MPVPPKPQQHFDPSGRHRLVNAETGKRTPFAPYSGITFMDGWVGVTAYYAEKECVLTPEEFVLLIAVKE